MRAKWRAPPSPGGAPTAAQHSNRKHDQTDSNPCLTLVLAHSIPAFLFRAPSLSLHTRTTASSSAAITLALQRCFWKNLADFQFLELISQAVAMASDGPALKRSGEMRERPSLEGQQPHHDGTGLHRTAEIHETESGSVELRKDPDHTSKPLANVSPEHILDPRGASVATKPEDILAVRRTRLILISNSTSLL